MKPERRTSSLRSQPIRWRFERPEPQPYVPGVSIIADFWHREEMRMRRQNMLLATLLQDEARDFLHLPARPTVKAK